MPSKTERYVSIQEVMKLSFTEAERLNGIGNFSFWEKNLARRLLIFPGSGVKEYLWNNLLLNAGYTEEETATVTVLLDEAVTSLIYASVNGSIMSSIQDSDKAGRELFEYICSRYGKLDAFKLDAFNRIEHLRRLVTSSETANSLKDFEDFNGIAKTVVEGSSPSVLLGSLYLLRLPPLVAKDIIFKGLAAGKSDDALDLATVKELAMNAVTEDIFGQASTPRAFAAKRRPPFTCYRCGKPGHMLRNCPLKYSNGDDVEQLNASD